MARTEKLQWTLAGLAAALTVVLTFELFLRVRFPWDHFIWAESPFMTDMLKLTAGQPVYTSPADANSTIYSPGLDYVTYALLRPLGLQLDVRFCRLVCVAIGVGGAIAAARFIRWMAEALAGERALGRRFQVFAIAAAILFVFKNHASDGCHPDNLYVLHATATLLLTYRASVSGRARDAALALAIAGLGILVKQTAVLSVGGAGALLVFLHWRSWRLGRTAAVLAVGALFVALAAWPLVRDANARFFAFELLSHHHVDPYRAKELIARDLLGVPHRVVLLFVFPPALFFFAFHERPEVRKLFAAWLVIGATEVSLSVASYFKILGTSNSLFVLDLWAALLVVPLLWHLTGQLAASGPDTNQAGARGPALLVSAAAGLLALIFVTLVPLKLAPRHVHREMAEALDAKVAEDVRAGKRVLLSYGVTPFVHAGVTAVPLDRASCNWEMDWAGLGDLAGTNARIRAHYYDKIYLWVALYSPETMALIEAGYHQVEAVPGDGSGLREDEFLFGSQGFMHAPIRVMEANPPADEVPDVSEP
jgi:Dolichyl-phosphate-mannose-protein mannosyltransferase